MTEWDLVLEGLALLLVIWKLFSLDRHNSHQDRAIARIEDHLGLE